MKELRLTVTSSGTVLTKQKEKQLGGVSFFRKLFPSNSSPSLTSPRRDSISSDPESPSTSRKLLDNDFEHRQPNILLFITFLLFLYSFFDKFLYAFERQEIYNIFRANNSQELNSAAGKAICYMFQHAKEVGKVDKFAVELMEAGIFNHAFAITLFHLIIIKIQIASQE